MSGSSFYADTYGLTPVINGMGSMTSLGGSRMHPKCVEAMEQASQLALNQVESHIGYHDDYLQDWCVKNKIQQQAYSPLGGGALAHSTDPAVLAAAKKHNKSSAQIGLRFLVQKGLSIIPKASDSTYQLENMALFDWQLDASDMASLGGLANPYRRGGSDGSRLAGPRACRNSRPGASGFPSFHHPLARRTRSSTVSSHTSAATDDQAQ